MKLRFTPLLLFSLITTSQVSGQVLHLGFAVGANLANAQTVPDLSSTIKTGGVLGASIEGKTDFDSWLSLRIEVTFVPRGANFKAENQFGPDSTFWRKYDYITLGIIAKGRLNWGKFRPYGMLGPVFGILSSATRMQDFGGQRLEHSIREDTEAIEWSFDFGLGTEYALTEDIYVFFDTRFSLGLTDVSKTALEWKARDIRLTAGVMFPLE